MIKKLLLIDNVLNSNVLTQKEIAEELNISQPYVSKLMSENITDLDLEITVKGYKTYHHSKDQLKDISNQS